MPLEDGISLDRPRQRFGRRGPLLAVWKNPEPDATVEQAGRNQPLEGEIFPRPRKSSTCTTKFRSSNTEVSALTRQNKNRVLQSGDDCKGPGEFSEIVEQ